MKKYLNTLLLCVSTFFGVLMFIFLALPMLTGQVLGTTPTLYANLDATGILIAFIFFLVGFLVSAFLFTISLLNVLGKSKMQVPFGEYIALCAALLLFVAFILFIASPASMASDSNGLYKVGAGSVLCAISAFIMCASLCLFGLKKVLKK